MNDRYSNRSSRKLNSFAALQATLIVGAISASVYSALDSNRRPSMPRLVETPRVVRPLYDDRRVITDEQLQSILEKIQPRFTTRPTKVNFIDHAVRMWGLDAEFDDGSLSGRQMLTMLLHHPRFAETWGMDAPALLRLEADGISVATQTGRTTVSHVDHLLGTLAEIGIPLSQRITTREGDSSVGAMMQHGLRSFRLNQREYEWTTLATAFYAADNTPWVSREGQIISFDSCARRLMRQRQPLGVCYGNHRIYTLVMLIRIDQQHRDESNGEQKLLSDETRLEVMSYLTDMTRRLCSTQSSKGSWDGNWPDASRAVPDPSTDETSRRILATGHALEWWAMAPASLLPPRETIIRASQWLIVTIESMDAAKIEKNFTFLTHAARALSLWRGSFPAEFAREINTEPLSESSLQETTESPDGR